MVGGCTPSSPGEGPPSIPSWPGPEAQQSLPWHSRGASGPVPSKVPRQTDCMPLHASTHTHTPPVSSGAQFQVPQLCSAVQAFSPLISWGQEELTNRGSLLRQASTNSLKGLLWWPSRVGGLFLGIRNRTRMGCRSELGGSPLASSMAVIPSDQMSAWTESHGATAVQAARTPRPPRRHAVPRPRHPAHLEVIG